MDGVNVCALWAFSHHTLALHCHNCRTFRPRRLLGMASMAQRGVPRVACLNGCERMTSVMGTLSTQIAALCFLLFGSALPTFQSVTAGTLSVKRAAYAYTSHVSPSRKNMVCSISRSRFLSQSRRFLLISSLIPYPSHPNVPPLDIVPPIAPTSPSWLRR